MMTATPIPALAPVLAGPQAERAAPGHPYDPATGTGIEWQPGVARMWEGGRISERARHATASPFEFWFWLQFAEAFPQVTHWWFGSAWTGKVWARPCPLPAAGRPPGGWMRFGDRAAPERPWRILPGDPPRIATPLPPLAGDARNLALRVALAGLAWEVHNGSCSGAPIPPGPRSPTGEPAAVRPGSGGVAVHEPGVVIVTSLVAREDLAAAFPLTPGRWYPAGVDRPLRQALCRCLGLPSPLWLASGH